MVPILIALILVGNLIFFWLNIKLLRTASVQLFKSPYIYGHILQLFGLIGLIIYATDLFDKEGYHIQLTLQSELPDLIKSISTVCWPLVVLICFTWGIPKIIDFLKTYKIVIPSLGISIENQQNVTVQTTNIVDTPEYNTLTDYQKENVTTIQNWLRNIPNQERETKLSIFTAITAAKVDHESTYNLIFGTQLSLLMTLRSNNSLVDITPFYEQHLSKLKETAPSYPPGTFEQWRGYLLTQSLMSVNGAEYKITPRGTDFLQYIESRNYTLNKSV